MITDNRVNTADWKCTDGWKKDNIQYRQFEAFFDGIKAFKKTMKKSNGTIKEWYVCNGFYFPNTKQLCIYLNEKEMQNKQPREWQNQFKYRLDISL